MLSGFPHMPMRFVISLRYQGNPVYGSVRVLFGAYRARNKQVSFPEDSCLVSLFLNSGGVIS